MRRYLVAAAVIMLVSVSAAPGKEPSHPLSQINPIDIDLNMSEQDIFNVSVFSLRDGLRFEGNQIQDSGGNPVLVWNDSSSQWELRNGDLNVQYNNISAPPGKNVSFQQNIRINGGGKIWVPESTNTPHYFYRKNLSEVLEDGESADRFDINLSGNNLESPDQIITDGSGSDVIEIRDRANTQDIARFREGGDVEVPNGNLNVSGNDLLVDHSSGKVAFGATSNLGHVTVKSTSDTPRLGGIIFQGKDSTSNYHGFGLNSNNDLVFEYYNGGWNDGLRIKQGSGNVEIPNGNLSLGGDYLTSVGGIQDCTQNEFLNGNGNCQVDTDTDQDNQTLSDVLVQGNKTGDTDIDLDGGELVDSSGSVTLGGGDVEVTDGSIDMTDSSGDVFGTHGRLKVNSNPFVIAPSSSKADVHIRADSGKDIAEFKDDTQNVVIPNGKLDLSGNNLTGFFDSACGENEAVTDVYNNGTFNCGQAGGGLPSVLDINNSANQDIDLYGNNITDSTGGNITFNQSLKVYGDLWLEGSASGGGGGSQNLSEVLENGNSTLGRGIDMDGGNITDIGGLQDCGQDEFVNGNGSCEVDTNTDTDNQNLQDVLVQGNATGGRDIDLDGGNLTDSTAGNVTIGKSLKVYGNIWAPEGAGLGGSQNLSEVLSNGNSTGGTDIDLDGANITDSTKGNVSVDDDLFVYGDIYGTGADLAEIYSSPQELEKGDVVAINTRKEDSVVRSSERYQETVAGVVSTNPGQTLNWNEDGYPIALAGKVPVKVTEENAEIEIGDRLVPSSTSGAAMKCETWDPLERKNKSLRRIVSHNQDCRNSAIGKALESSTGRGKILVKLE